MSIFLAEVQFSAAELSAVLAENIPSLFAKPSGALKLADIIKESSISKNFNFMHSPLSNSLLCCLSLAFGAARQRANLI